MSRLRVLTALATVAVVLAASSWCFAESITLTSSSGGVYDYGFMAGPIQTAFTTGDTITLSGLSGVMGASAPPPDPLGFCFNKNSFTPSSVVYTATAQCVLGSIPLTGTLVVDSSVLTLGTVDFSMRTFNMGTITGTTQGPVAVPVPEPASLMLLGTGLLGLVGLARRTWSH